LDPDPSKQQYILIASFNFLAATAYDSSTMFFILLLLGLLLLSALISGSEVAFFSLSPQDFHHLEQEGTSEARRILKLRDTPRTLLATILIFNNLVNIMIVILSDVIISSSLSEELLMSWGEYLSDGLFLQVDAVAYAKGIEFLLTIVFATFLLVLFGEVTPKIYANSNNLILAKRLSGMLIFLQGIFGPVSKLLVKSTNLIEHRFQKVKSASGSTSRDEIDRAIDLTVLHEYDAETEKTMLKSIVKFGEVSAKQIMKARVDIVALDEESDFTEVMKVIRDSGYSRIPVYRDDLDNIIGILYVKDLLGHFNAASNFNWQSLLRTNILYVPEAKKINEVLKDFRRNKVHMALVVDEYGGTSGLVTLEDILEEVIGEIKDEFDDEQEISYEKIDDNVYIFDGKTMINDMCKVVGIEKEIFEEIRGDADSIAGLFLEMYGQIPKLHTEIKFRNFNFQVNKVNKRRIEKIKIVVSR
jgi:putative hemolysin